MIDNLIASNVADLLQLYVSIQSDIDDQKVKASAQMAQDKYLLPIIGRDNLDRCITPLNADDHELRDLILRPYCLYTYVELLTGFLGIFTDGGYVVEENAMDKASVKATADHHLANAEILMNNVIFFLKEDETIDADTKATKPRIRIIGGEENL